MEAVMLSIRPKWCELIASGKKTVEVRKTRPRIETPFKCYIYCTKPKHAYEDIISAPTTKDTYLYAGGKVIGEFVCDKIFEIDYGIEEGVYFDGVYQQGFETNSIGNNPTCLSFVDLENYLTDNEGYGWHISDLVIYDKPKELSEFCRYCGDECPNEDCKYLDGMRGYEYDERDCFCNFYRPLERPPQSWCYVEELEA